MISPRRISSRALIVTAICVAIPLLQPLSAQSVSGDSVFVASSEHSPKGALRRSAFVPGWGQIYNRQYVKLPFVYGAIGGLLYTALTKHDEYILYRKAFQYKAFQELVESGQLSENPKIDFLSSYEAIEAEFGAVSSRPLSNRRNNLRRSRDLSLIGVGLVYSLAMLDAYVSAHLLDFDVGDNLSFQANPQPGGFRLSARIQLGYPEGRGLSSR